MNNIFLFDIDGTLSFNGIIPLSAKEIIKKIREKGDLVLLATGRCKAQLDSILEEIIVDGAIMNNGGYIVVKDEIIYKNPIDKESIIKLMDMGYHVAILNEKHYARVEDHKIFKEFADYFKIDSARLLPYDILNEDCYSLGVYTYYPKNLDKNLFPKLDFVQVAPLGFDVISHNVSKGNAVKILKEKYKDVRIIAFGDNYNDKEMLMASDISIAMPSSPKEVLDIASFVTKAPLDDGISYAIKEYLKYED